MKPVKHRHFTEGSHSGPYWYIAGDFYRTRVSIFHGINPPSEVLMDFGKFYYQCWQGNDDCELMATKSFPEGKMPLLFLRGELFQVTKGELITVAPNVLPIPVKESSPEASPLVPVSPL